MNRLGDRVGGERGDQFGRPHDRILFTTGAPPGGAERLQRPVQRHPHRHFGHRQARRGGGDRLPVERDRADDVALARRQRLDQLLRVAQRVRVLLGGRGEKILKILDRLGAPRAPPAHRVDDLVASDRIHPRAELLARVPGVALQMDRQQSLLHRILDIGVAQSRARERRPRHRPHRTADFLQQTPVNAFVARDRGLHHARPGIVRGTLDRWGAHTAFVPIRLVLQVPTSFSAARTRFVAATV